jgi:hypothetical protein
MRLPPSYPAAANTTRARRCSHAWRLLSATSSWKSYGARRTACGGTASTSWRRWSRFARTCRGKIGHPNWPRSSAAGSSAARMAGWCSSARRTGCGPAGGRSRDGSTIRITLWNFAAQEIARMRSTIGKRSKRRGSYKLTDGMSITEVAIRRALDRYNANPGYQSGKVVNIDVVKSLVRRGRTKRPRG